MFEGFDSRTVPGEGADIYLRVGGAGPPLLLPEESPEATLDALAGFFRG
jgi:haloacetate dehalogenase